MNPKIVITNHPRKIYSSILSIAILLVWLTNSHIQVSGQVFLDEGRNSETEFSPGVILVRFKQEPVSYQLSAIENDLNGMVAEKIPHVLWRVMHVPPGQEKLALKRALSNPYLSGAELDYKFKASTSISPDLINQVSNYCFPDSPTFEGQWALNLTGAPAVWSITSGSPDILVGVIDSGIQLDHPDLETQIWINEDEIPGNLIDDDANGKIDDIQGWHFYDSGFENNNVVDDFGHGTHIAGVISAAKNDTGITGIAYDSRVLAVKVLDQYGEGWASDIAAGIIYAVDNGASIINLSIGAALDITILKEAVDYATEQGAILIAAAGNDGTESIDYPAKYPNVIAVAATDSSDQRTSYSDYGPEMDIAAPGDRICSTWYRGNYFYKSGTSMAAPHVAGVAALIWSADPTMTADQVELNLKESAVDINLAGWDIYTGWGRVSVMNFFLPQRCYLPFINR